MRLRHWLADIFQDEATGAGEDSAAGAAPDDTSPSPAASSHEENKAFVEQWAAGRSGSEDEPIKTAATATTAEPLKEIPVETTSTDAVSDDDAGSKDAEETGLDPLLMNLAAAYDYTPDDVKGFDNEGLKRLLARERRLRGDAAPAADATKPADAKATGTTPALQTLPVEADKTPPQAVTFAEYQATLEEKLSEEGLGDDAIKREVKLAKARWDREEAILTDARQARSEAEQMRQEMNNQKAEYERKLEVNSLLDVADQFARDGLSVLGSPDAVWTEAQQAARMKYVQAYDVLKTMHPDVPLKKLAPIAMDIAFHEEIQKREAKSHARRVMQQANQVQESGFPVKTLAKPDSPWDAPEIERQFQKMKRNAT